MVPSDMCAIWSKSSLGAFWVAKDAKSVYADNEDFDQTTQKRRLIWVLVVRAYPTVRFIRTATRDKELSEMSLSENFEQSSESLLGAWINFVSLAIQWMSSKDPDQAALINSYLSLGLLYILEDKFLTFQFIYLFIFSFVCWFIYLFIYLSFNYIFDLFIYLLLFLYLW